MSLRYLFTCAICNRDVAPFGMNRGPDKQVAPVCKYCTEHYAGRSPLQGGSWADRRRAKQIAALSEALSSAAHFKRWEEQHGRA